MALQEVFMTLHNWGVFDVLIPFLLLYAMFFGLLNKTTLFSSKPKYNAIVSVCVALIFVVSLVRVLVITKFILFATTFMVGGFLFLMMFSMATEISTLQEKKWLVSIVIITLLAAFFISLDWHRLADWSDLKEFLFDPSWIILLFLILIVMWISGSLGFLTGEPAPDRDRGRDRGGPDDRGRPDDRTGDRGRTGDRTGDRGRSDDRTRTPEEIDEAIQRGRYPRRAGARPPGRQSRQRYPRRRARRRRP